uniref:Putative secreted protein n=1 Tax=Anopheles marajoara TaxID=58244 RepID=A0A2M4CB96_9DIPT
MLWFRSSAWVRWRVVLSLGACGRLSLCFRLSFWCPVLLSFPRRPTVQSECLVFCHSASSLRVSTVYRTSALGQQSWSRHDHE